MDFGESVSFGGGSTRYERQAMVGIQEWTGVSHLTVDGTGVTLRDGADLASYTVGNMGCGDLSARSSASTIVKDGYGLSPDDMGNIVFNSSSRMGIYSPGRDLNLAGVYTMKSGSSIGHVSACMGGLSSMPSTVTISGEMILEGEIPYTLDSSTTVIITGKLSGSGKLVPAPDNKGTLINNSSDNSSNTSDGAVSIVKEKTTKLEGVKPDEEVIALAKETLILVGERGGIHVPQSAVLKGTGKAANVSVYGVVAPGFSPGCLTFNSLYLAGEYQVELGGTEACSGYDQIRVLGDMGSEPLRLDSDRATLSLYGFGDFVQQKDDQFTIIDNQTEHAVQGTFKGLAEGAEVKVGEAIFTISYKGGDGNDVVLTAQNSAKLPGVPNTGIAQIISANPVVVAVMGVLTAGVLMLVRRKARQ